MNSTENLKEIAKVEKQEVGILTPEEKMFRLGQREAQLLSSSKLLPTHFQGNVADCYIGLQLAKRMKADAFLVLQNIHIIHGKPSFSSQFLIATVNASGKFSPLRFKFNSNKTSCLAYATDLQTGDVLEGSTITMELAKKEGWSTKSGSKWLTMPEQMLMYRSAAFWVRTYAPELSTGMTVEEIKDIEEPKKEVKNVTPVKSAEKMKTVIEEKPAKEEAKELF